MDRIFSDEEIEMLIAEAKPVEIPLSQIGSNFTTKRGHKESQISIKREDGSQFRIIIRQLIENPLAFSVILGFIPKDRNEVFILRRYNGKNHRHSNRIERQPPFYDFHIHTASERYQLQGMNEEGFAEVTSRYADITGAVDCLIADCGIISTNDQKDLPFR